MMMRLLRTYLSNCHPSLGHCVLLHYSFSHPKSCNSIVVVVLPVLVISVLDKPHQEIIVHR